MKKRYLVWLMIAMMVFSPVAAFADAEEAVSEDQAQAETVLDEDVPSEEVVDEEIPAEETVEEALPEEAEEEALPEEAVEEALPEETVEEALPEEAVEEALPEEVTEEAVEESAAPAEKDAVTAGKTAEPSPAKKSAVSTEFESVPKTEFLDVKDNEVDPYDACTWTDSSMSQAKDSAGNIVKGLFKAKRAQGGIGLYYAGSDGKVVKTEKKITVSDGWRFLYSSNNGETFWNNVSGGTYSYLIRNHNGDFYIENLQGIYSIGGKKYYVKKDGTVKTDSGFVDYGGKKYFVTKGGVIRTKNGWINYKGKKYRMSGGSVRTKVGAFKVGKYRYVVKSDASICTKVGPIKVNGTYYYVRNTKGTLGNYKVYTYNGEKYHVNKKGIIRVGRHKWKDGLWYYSVKKGYLKNKKAIVTNNGERFLVEKGGLIVVNQKFTFNNRQYIANKKGTIYTGLFEWKGTLYYASDKGVLKRQAGMVTVGQNNYFVEAGGVVDVNKKVWTNGLLYIADKDGTLFKNEFFNFSDREGTHRYYADETCSVYYDKKFTVTGKTYFTNSKGWIQKGKFRFKGTYYYTDSNGALDTTARIFNDNGKYYYNKSGGSLACSEWVHVGNKWYYASSNASFITGRHRFHNNAVVVEFDERTGEISEEAYEEYLEKAENVVNG